MSFEAAINRLGGLPIMLRPDELQLGRGEPIADTARVLSSYCEAIVIRTFAQRDVRELAESSIVPVINALTDDHHPCQALADLLTLRERFGSLEGLTLAYVGDGNNVAHSLIEAAALDRHEPALASPPGCLPDPSILAAAGAVGAHRQTTRDEAVAGAHAVYTDVWVSMGKEDRGAAGKATSSATGSTPRADGAGAARRGLPALPARPPRRGGRQPRDRRARSAVWQQAANRLPTEQAAAVRAGHRRWEG